MFCRNCGNKIKPGSQSCEICGQNPASGENYCPECGHICIPGDEKCVGCGFPLSVSAITQEVTPPPIPQPQTETVSSGSAQMTSGPKFTASGQRYCRNCGLIIPDDADKCPYCETPKGLGNNYCPDCGSGTIASDVVCPVCSAKLTPIKQNPAPNYIPSAPPVQRQQQQTYQQPPHQTTINYNNPTQIVFENSSVGDKSRDIAILLGILPALFGFCGVHRLYTGHILSGLFQLFTLGMCGVWQLIDVIMILSGSFRDNEGKKLS
ncbi:MAG: NINE protein [Bacteroidales bacterium]|nr:NINE protein [Bacteroidales bacterium]